MPTNTEPFRGAEQTVAKLTANILAAQTQYPVRQLVEKICREIRSKDALSEALAIYHYVDANCRYMRDPSTVELIKTPVNIANEFLAGKRPNIDCDDMTSIIGSLLMAAGHRVRLATVAFHDAKVRGQRQYSHVFAQYYDGRSGLWMTLDPVARERSASMHARTAFARVYPLG